MWRALPAADAAGGTLAWVSAAVSTTVSTTVAQEPTTRLAAASVALAAASVALAAAALAAAALAAATAAASATRILGSVLATCAPAAVAAAAAAVCAAAASGSAAQAATVARDQQLHAHATGPTAVHRPALRCWALVERGLSPVRAVPSGHLQRPRWVESHRVRRVPGRPVRAARGLAPVRALPSRKLRIGERPARMRHVRSVRPSVHDDAARGEHLARRVRVRRGRVAA